MTDPRIFVSLKIGTTGDAPGSGSMTELCVVAFTIDCELRETELPRSADDPSVFPSAWIIGSKRWEIIETEGYNPTYLDEYWKENLCSPDEDGDTGVHPRRAMREFDTWIKEIKERRWVTFVGWDVAKSWLFLKYYHVKYGPQNPQWLDHDVECICTLNNILTDGSVFSENEIAAIDVACRWQAELDSDDLLVLAKAQAYTYAKMKQYIRGLMRRPVNPPDTVPDVHHSIATSDSNVPPNHVTDRLNKHVQYYFVFTSRIHSVDSRIETGNPRVC